MAEQRSYRQSRQSNRNSLPPTEQNSPVRAISRTPTADRRLLRALTGTPEDADQLSDNQTPDAPPNQLSPTTYQRQKPNQSSRNDYQNKNKDSRQNEINNGRDGSELSQVTNARTVIQLSPTISSQTKAEDWQTGKTVAQANSYMLRYEVACDVTFMVGESREEIRAHKYILMARSAQLFKMLVKHLGNMDVKINVPDIKPAIFRELLQYLYTDEFDIHSDNVTPMLYAAKKFQLQGLSNLCFSFLEAEMNTDNVCRIMEQAHIYSENALYDKCLRFINLNGNEVLTKPAFGELCTECVQKIIQPSDLNADEDKVYEGCIIWANAECRKDKKQPTDENRRAMLGDLLFLIRFPTMDITYFTHKVSLGNILTHDETLSIFQYFHGEVQQLPNRFNKKPRNRVAINAKDKLQDLVTLPDRRSPNYGSIARVTRFGSCSGEWKQNGPADAISFTVSRSVILYGIQIYGTARGQEMFTVKVYIYDDTKEEIRKTDATIYTNTSKQKYDVYLSEPVRIPSKRVFTILVLIKGGPTRKGIDGELVKKENGVTFEFISSNKSSNGTDTTVGQIPGLLFSLAHQ